jgi:protein-disulfide isomerase
LAQQTARRAHERTLQRAAQRRHKSQQWMIVGIAAAAVIIAVVLILVSRPAPIAPITTSYDGIEQTVDTSGAFGLSLGSADAPVTLTEYSDFSCPHCHEITPAIHQLIEEYVQTGQLRIIYKPISFVNPPYSTDAASAAICAAQQGQGWQMHDQIWALYEQGGPGGYSKGTFTSMVRGMGLDEAAFSQCFNSNATAASVQSVLDEARSLGINGTPSLYVNGEPVTYTGPDAIYLTLKDAIDSALGQ